MPLGPKAIEQRARAILEEHELDELPVKVAEVAKRLGAEVRKKPSPDGISGMLWRQDGKPVIAVDSRDHRHRQRFTIAHEIGHLVLHADEVHVDRGYRSEALRQGPSGVYRRSPRSSEGSDPMEIEANRFAASLLMPAHQLDRSLELEGAIDPIRSTTVRELAKAYQVSEQAMVFRLMNLGRAVESA